MKLGFNIISQDVRVACRHRGDRKACILNPTSDRWQDDRRDLDKNFDHTLYRYPVIIMLEIFVR
jgi:hypothetical protein